MIKANSPRFLATSSSSFRFSSRWSVTGLFGPVPTQDSAVSPWPPGEIAAFAHAAHSFLDTYGTATRDVIVKFLAAPRRCPSRQPAGAHRENDRRAIRRGRAGRPRHVGGCTAARLLSRQLPGHQAAGLRPHYAELSCRGTKGCGESSKLALKL